MRPVGEGLVIEVKPPTYGELNDGPGDHSGLAAVPVWTSSQWDELNALLSRKGMWDALLMVVVPVLAALAENGTDWLDQAQAARGLWELKDLALKAEDRS
jgi:hypothetical protein